MNRLVMDSNKENRPQNPRENANIFEILTFSWLINLFKTILNRELEESDLYTTLTDHSSSLLGNELEKKWRVELDISNKINRRPSLLRVLIQMFGAQYLFYGFLLAVNEIILKITQPLCVGGLLSYISSNSSNKMDLRYAYVFAFALFLNIFITSVVYHSIQMEILHCGMKIRVACCSVIYRKALYLSYTTHGETTVGQMINLLSNDASRFDNNLTAIQFLWIGPLQTIIITYFVWREIGVSALIGVATLIIFIPLQGWLGKKMSGFRLKTAYFTDKRASLMNEIISGIQVIKIYTWENPFANRIEQLRRKEIQQIRRSLIIRTILLSFTDFQTKLQVFIIILSYVLLGNYISIKTVYVVTSFYSLLAKSMGMFFSQGTGQIAELLVSIKRIQKLLIHIEKNSKKSECSNSMKPMNYNSNEISSVNYDTKKVVAQQLNSIAIVFSNATAKWTSDQTENTLECINLTIGPGTLVAIAGPVGCGKSSLLQSILGELPLSEGNINIRGIVSYASQEPWLFSGSILENILFKSPMNKQRYKHVIKACALKSDFEHFPYGDQTIVGDRGVTLSGGQKARINLARAIYREADIYLLDDPLSAVDTRVGKHLFEKCIKGYLKEKTCILITHQRQFVANVDQIVLMENARIKTTGSYQELHASGYDFSELLSFTEETIFESQAQCDNVNKKSLDVCHILSRSAESIISPIESVSMKPNEEREIHSSGQVSKNVYKSYYISCGSIFKTIFVLFIFLLSQILTTFGDFWISFWVNEEEDLCRKVDTIVRLNSTLTIHNIVDTSSNIRFNHIIVYTVITVLIVLSTIMRSAIFVSACISASINLHNKMFNTMLRTSMYFFNTNSCGRILNRFSKDMGAIDESLPLVLFSCFQEMVTFFGIIFVVGLVNIYLLIPTIVVGILFYKLRKFYLPASQSVKRLEGITRSPVYGQMAASIRGIITLRAYKTENVFIKEFDKHQDIHSSAWYMFIALNEGFGVWLDFVCFVYMSIVTLCFFIMDSPANGGNVGLFVTQIVTLKGMMQWLIRQSAGLENEMTSVERVLEYANSPKEAELHTLPNKPLPNEWPSKGEIVFLNFGLRYSPDTPQYVLKNINITIQPKEKIGIVGRTGAGKSSLIAALLRLAFNEGNVFIDEVEIHSLRLHELRSRISIIPQEPVLFSGTMRTNLDPFDEYPDHILWDALHKMELKKTMENLPGGLNTKISESGSNFSVGERQLVCLARAIIRNNKILVLDEATANVDPQTDAIIQNKIRNHFETCTVLTIAHRLNTVMDSDKIIVMDAGRIVEFGHSHCLLKNKDGFLFKMVKQTGRVTADLLERLAAESYKSMETKALI